MLSFQNLLQEFLEVCVVGLRLELEITDIYKEFCYFVGQICTQDIQGYRQFLLGYLLVLLLLISSLHALPGQIPFHEVYQHIYEALQIISPALFHSQMGVNGCIPRCACQVLVVPVRNMLPVLLVFLSQPEVYQVHFVHLISPSDKKIIWLNISMQNPFRVNVLQQFEDLQPNPDPCAQTELLVANIEQLLQTRPQKFHRHHIVIIRRRVEQHLRQPKLLLSFTTFLSQQLKNITLRQKLRILGVSWLKLDGNWHLILLVYRQVDLPESPLTQFLEELETPIRGVSRFLLNRHLFDHINILYLQQGNGYQMGVLLKGILRLYNYKEGIEGLFYYSIYSIIEGYWGGRVTFEERGEEGMGGVGLGLGGCLSPVGGYLKGVGVVSLFALLDAST